MNSAKQHNAYETVKGFFSKTLQLQLDRLGSLYPGQWVNHLISVNDRRVSYKRKYPELKNKPDDELWVPQSVMRKKDLTSSAKLVYAVLVERTDGPLYAWPSIRRIALDIGVDNKTVLRAIKQLIKNGLLKKIKHENGKCNDYEIVRAG